MTDPRRLLIENTGVVRPHLSRFNSVAFNPRIIYSLSAAYVTIIRGLSTRRRITRERISDTRNASDALLLTRNIIISLISFTTNHRTKQYLQLEMWTNAQRDGRPAEYRWRPLFNDAKFG